MNKKVIITIIAIVLIVVLAVIVGKNISQKDSTNTNANPIDNATVSPTPSEETATPDIEETPTLEPSPTNTSSPEPVVNTATYSAEQKKEYAKSIAKKTWEKLGVSTKVYYSFDDNITSDGKYIVVVREEATTKELVRYEIDISTGNCKIVY